MSKPCADRLRQAILAAALLAAAGLSACHTVRSSPQGGDAVAAAPDAPLSDSVQRSYGDALTAMRGEDWSAAQTLLQPLAEAHPELPGPAVNLGIVYARLNRPDEAQKTLEHAAASFPKFAPGQHQLGLLLSAQGHFEEADAAYQRAETADPAYAVAFYDRAVLNELYLQRPQVALQDYQAYQKLQGTPDAQVGHWITDLQRRLGMPKTSDKPANQSGDKPADKTADKPADAAADPASPAAQGTPAP